MKRSHHPLAELIAKKLFGIEGASPAYQRRAVSLAAREAVKWHEKALSLSERIRPNSEAAQWVIEEVKTIEKERDRLREAIKNHRRNVWGDGYVAHNDDRDLYSVLKDGV